MLYPADPEYSGDGTHFIFHYWEVKKFSLPFENSEEVYFIGMSRTNTRQSIWKS
jgi:hypothetical protein